jgi:hypothetical protein
MLNTKQTNRRFHTEWYECSKCGNQYPRQMVIVQNGAIVCQGSNTRNCYDMPGHAAAMMRVRTGYEETPAELPSVDEDL